MSQNAKAAAVRVRVWDLPTRLFHWLLAAAVLCCIVSAKTGAMVWHFRFGLLVLALLVFRLVWGFLGGRWSRFGSFLFAPAKMVRYLRSTPGERAAFEVGHNPLGALSVFALLAILLAQVATGLVADDEISNVGPLNRFVEMATASSATSWHNTWGQWIILGLAGLHIAVVFFYLGVKRLNLIGPMWAGDKLLPPGTPGSEDSPRQRLVAAVLAAVALAAVVWIARLGG
jgi:cytochrome b